MKIVYRGTNTPIDANKYPNVITKWTDLDVVDHLIATNKSDATRYAGHYSEGIGLVSGYRSPFYVTPDTLVKIDTVDGNQRIRGSGKDGGTIRSGGYFEASAQGFTWTWYGSTGKDGDGMGSTIHGSPEVSVLATAGAGGSITPAGGSSHPLNSPTSFTYTPNPGWAVSSLTVDGSPV